jgi:NADH-quinone oxidoreductase subunit H
MVEFLQQVLPGFMVPHLNWALGLGQNFFGSAWNDILTVVWVVARCVFIIAVLLGCIAYITFCERKVIGWMQVRIGPNRVGPWGLIQPIADGLKLLLKEVVIPAGADKTVFLLAPLISFAPAVAAWAVIPFNSTMVLANANASLLYILAMTSISVYGIMLAGWSSNSKYAFLGGMRSAAQLISYEVAMGLALVVVLMVSNSLNLGDIVMAQGKGRMAEMGLKFLSWNWLPLLPMCVVYMVAMVAETNRAPFDMAEGESEIIGFHVEYSGMAFAVFQLAEYGAMVLCSTIASLIFFGGWLSPVGFLPDSAIWLFVKIFTIIIFFFWIRATFPRFRYDQIMRLGWKVFIPVCLVWLVVVGCWMISPLSIWK